jgi:glutaredoxin 3
MLRGSGKSKIFKAKKGDKKMINVYSTPTCPWCHKLKGFLKEHKVEFKDFNVAEDDTARDKMVEGSGQMGVPVIEIDGEYLVGFDPIILKEKLKLGDA